MTDGTGTDGQIRRLNWGCGAEGEPGWINSDQKEGPGIDISCDIRDGLPLETDCIDYAVSIHALPEIPYPELVPALAELHRVLKPGGVLRLALPDMDKAIAAYSQGDHSYFLIPDDEIRSLSGKMIVQLTWYGYSRSFFTREFTAELLTKAGFHHVDQVGYRTSKSTFDGITELDNREGESLFVEGTK